jgi:hypothetical protein
MAAKAKILRPFVLSKHGFSTELSTIAVDMYGRVQNMCLEIERSVL